MSAPKKQKLEGGVEHLQKQCLTVLKAIQRKKEAIFFLEPVDWKALNLPLYPTLIKKPMDLGTVERKLQESPCAYKTVADFADAVNLVFSNAHTFNLEGSDIYSFATTCKEAFEAKMADVDHHGKLRESASKHAGGDVLAACKKVVSELKKNKNAELFLAPVDWKALGLIDYPIVIKKPMDLGTISSNIEGGKYKSASGVAADVDLVWSNAMTYNLDGSFVYAAAASMKAEAKKKFAPLLAAGGSSKGTSGGGSGKDGGGGGGSSGGSGKAKGAASSSGGGLAGDELAACKKVVSELKKNKNAELFLAPVDWKALGLTNYLAVIKKPMDLGTISSNIESGKYDSVLGVAADIDLVWNNAMTYNLPGSYVYETALDLQKLAKQKLSPLVAAATGIVEPPEPEVTFDMRKQLNEDVAQLTPGQLCGFLRVVQAACSRSVTDGVEGDIEIDLDALDLPAFLKVDEYVSEAVGRRKMRSAPAAR